MTTSTLPAISTIAQIRSARVKSTDFHATRQQILIGLYSGEVILYDYKSCQQIKQVSLVASPIRCVKYFGDGMYFAIGSDDGHLRVYDSYSFQLRQNIKAHVDVLRSIVAHPQADVLFTAGDDAVIRAWSFNKATSKIELEAEYTGHEHYVMSISSDPQGLRLVSASQDKTVKVWDISYYMNMEEFSSKVKDGRIGSQMGKRDETLIDKLTVANAQKLKNQAQNYLTGLVTNAQGLTSAEIDLQPKVKFDPLFTMSGHQDCVNGAVWIESQLLSGGQENPYAQGCLQYVASVSDDHDIFIWDTYSRQVIKKLQCHSDVVNAIYYIKQLSVIITVSDDNQTILTSTQTMQQERTLNFSLERGWTINSIQSGASTIMSLGYDSGAVVLRVGDFAPVCAFNSQKATRFAVSGQFAHQYSKVENSLSVGGIIPKSTGNIAFCNNLAKALTTDPEFKQLSEDIPSVIKSMNYSPNGKFLAIQGEEEIVVLSALTGKTKFQVKCRQFAFAAQFQPELFTISDKPEEYDYSSYESELESRNVYAVITEKQRRLIKIYNAGDTAELFKIKLDAPIDRLFAGPLLCCSNQDSLFVYDWEEGQFVTQLDINVQQVFWNTAGDIVALITPQECFIIQINFGAIQSQLCSEDYDEYDGVENAFTELVTLQTQISSGTFTQDSKLFVYADQEGVHQLFLDEIMQQTEQTASSVMLNVEQLKQVIQVLGTYQLDEATERIILFGEANQSYYPESSCLFVAAVNVDKSVLQFKQFALNGQIQQAVEFASSNLKSRSQIEFAADFLIKIKADSDVILNMLEDTKMRIKYAHRLERYDVVTELIGDDIKLAAEDAFRGGYVEEAMQFYVQLEDWQMVLLCAYILGDSDALELLVEKADNNVKYRAAVLLNDNQAAIEALSSSCLQAAFKRARGTLTQQDILKWKLQLNENKRQEVAELIEEEL